MDDQYDQLAQRDAFDAEGQRRWDASTRSGENLGASRPVDVAALGASVSPTATVADEASQASDAGSPDSGSAADQANAAPSAPTPPAVRYVKARPGDNITALVGSSDPGAIGTFARLNGMNGRNSTIYAGRVYALPSANDAATRDDAALGRQLMRHDSARLAALRAQRAAKDQFQARFAANQNVWTGQPVSAAAPTRASPPGRLPPRRQAQSWADNVEKEFVGAGAYGVGAVFGVPSAVMDAVGDVWDAGKFGLQWAGAFGPQAQAQANRQASNVASGALRYAQAAIDDPSRVASDARDAAGRAIDNMSPLNADLSGSLWDVTKHQFVHGRNFGESAANVVGLFAGGEAVQGLRAAAAFEATRPAKIAKLVAEGVNPKLAAYLSEPYQGMGHHAIVPRRLAKKMNLPSWLVDSPINVSSPRGMSRNDFYKHHYQVDPMAGGFRLPADLNGGKGWRPKELGLTKYNLPQRVWYGTPVPLKNAMAAVPFANSPAFYGQLEQPQ